MPKATDIIDYLTLTARVDGLTRRDLEQRLKRLRAARLYPPARAVGDRKAEPANDQYMANLFLAMVGSAEAKYCAEAVNRLYDLPVNLRLSVERRAVEALLREAGGLSVTLGDLLLWDIRNTRRGKAPAVEEVLAVHGKALALVTFRSIGEAYMEPYDPPVVFFGTRRHDEQRQRVISIYLTDGVIQALADFLGPIEDAT